MKPETVAAVSPPKPGTAQPYAARAPGVSPPTDEAQGHNWGCEVWVLSSSYRCFSAFQPASAATQGSTVPWVRALHCVGWKRYCAKKGNLQQGPGTVWGGVPEYLGWDCCRDLLLRKPLGEKHLLGQTLQSHILCLCCPGRQTLATCGHQTSEM